MASNFLLPKETLVEIFSFLPTKSVCRFKLLSPTWNTEFSTPHFIQLHETRKPTHESIILLSRSGRLYVLTPPLSNGELWSPRPINPGSRWGRMLGSSNGLVLLQSRTRSNMFVVNPVTRQQVQVTNPPFVSRNDSIIVSGFGNDKIVILYKKIKRDGLEYDMVGLYCLTTRVWKTLEYPLGICDHTANVMPLVNGCLHWFSIPNDLLPDRITALDLATETFIDIPLPTEKFAFDGLTVLRGCLGNVITDLGLGTTEVWVMNEYRNGDSWVRFLFQHDFGVSRLRFQFPASDWMSGGVRPLNLVGEQNMLCITNSDVDDERWGVCNLEEGMGTFTAGGINHVRFVDWVLFQASLVSPIF